MSIKIKIKTISLAVILGLSLAICGIIFFPTSSVFSQKKHHNYSAAEKSQINFSKYIHKLFIQGKLKAVYSHFDTNITQKMTFDQFATKVKQIKENISFYIGSAPIDKVLTMRDTEHVVSWGLGQPQQGQHISFRFLTSYKNTQLKTIFYIMWLNTKNKQKVPRIRGFSWRFMQPVASKKH